MAITENTNRIGNFSSSENWKLTKLNKEGNDFGEKSLTYIKEKKFERKLKRSINIDTSTRPTVWGKYLESIVFEKLPLTYRYIFDETFTHPLYNFWCGSPDLDNENENVVSDIKCPQPKAFAELIENLTKAIELNDISIFKKEHEEYYWQLVSNACIKGRKFIELIVYMPYLSDLQSIKESVEKADLEEPWKYRFIQESLNCELPYLPNDSEYKDLNIFRFELNIEDALFLETQIKKAENKLTNK